MVAVLMTLVLVVMPLVLVTPAATATRLRDPRFMSKNVSSTLDALLAKGTYDRRIRPDLGGPPTLVTVSVYIKSMSSVSETDEKYSMDTYFRQSWFDPRLRFSLPGIDEFSMSWLFLDRVWKPDTFIVNGHRSYLHRITVPNKFARVRSDGFVTYSMRLTLQASCPMHLRKFPMDSQRCPLLIGSYGYTASDMVYAWHPTGVGLEPGVELAQYDLVNISITDAQLIRRGQEEFSMISASFHLRRNTGYYTLQVFVPCGLIVCSSWVSFWIDPDAVPARVSLAVTTVLSMTTMGFGGRASMPRVNYATALDWFVIMCFAFVFAVMLEYAAINFIDKVTVDLRRLLEERKKKKNSTASAAAAEDAASSAGAGAGAAPVVTAPGTAPGTPRPTPRSRSRSVDLGSATVVPLPPLGGIAARRMSLQGRGPRRRSSAGSVIAVHAEAAAAPAIVVDSAEDEIVYADLDSVVEAGARAGLVAADCVVAVEDDPETALLAAGLGLGPEPEPAILLAVPGGPGAEGRPGSSLRRTQSLRRCLSVPYRLWEQTRFLPNEEDISRQMQSDEEPDKFTSIDIVSRKVFPIAFGSMLMLYWIMYGYYISDYFPGEEDRVVLYDLARPRGPRPQNRH